jgi:hypothetical protein
MTDMVRLKAGFGSDEVNCRGKSYRVNQWGVVTVPAEDVEPLLKVGGFSRAVENNPTAPNSDLSDVLDVVWHLEPGRIRSTFAHAGHEHQCDELRDPVGASEYPNRLNRIEVRPGFFRPPHTIARFERLPFHRREHAARSWSRRPQSLSAWLRIVLVRR